MRITRSTPVRESNPIPPESDRNTIADRGNNMNNGHRRGPSMASVTSTMRNQLNPHQTRQADLEQGGTIRDPDHQIAQSGPDIGLIPRIDPGWRSELLVWQSEFVGTVVFLTTAFGGLHETNSNLENALAFGLSLAVSVFLFGKSLMNPAVLLAQFMESEMPLIRAINLFSAEVAGAIAASGLILALTGDVKGVVSLAPGVSVAQGLFIDAVCAGVLSYVVLLVSHQKSGATTNTPLLVGMTLAALELFAIPYNSGAVNFARAIGPSIVARRFNNYDWIYFVSNIIGAISASAYYKFTRAVQEAPTIQPIFGPALAVPARVIANPRMDTVI